MKIVGITGSIGCGKTYLANIIKKLGFSVYNPDFWVRDLYRKKDFLQVIAREFPQTFENGVFNKRKLRTLVFDDNKQLKKLESLIHPFLGKKLKKIIKSQETKRGKGEKKTYKHKSRTINKICSWQENTLY